MKRGTFLEIAKVHLLSRKRQSVVASLGVTFGIAMYIAMMGFMIGINEFLEELMLSNIAHVHIYNEVEVKQKSVLDEVINGESVGIVHNIKPYDVRKDLKDAPQILEIIKKDPDVIGASPFVSTQVFYNYGSININGVVAGVDIVEEEKLFKISRNLISGELKDILSIKDGAFMGKGLAQKLNLNKGDKVNITSVDGAQFQLKIVGLFSTGISLLDDSQCYVDLATVQKILNKNKSFITDINIKLDDINKSVNKASYYEAKFGYDADDWIEANEQILISFTMRNFITYAVVISLLVVAGFGIYNILTMMIYEKMKDIAILKAMGYTGADVRNIFMTEALIIGLFGGVLGLLLGFVMSFGISQIPFESSSVIYMDKLPVSFNPKFYITGFLFAMATVAIAGFLPARKASKIDPVEIIRGN